MDRQRFFQLFKYHNTSLTRFIFLRAISVIYFVAFLVYVHQWEPLIGSNGLSPANLFLDSIKHRIYFFDLPTLFWWNASDLLLGTIGWIGLILAGLSMVGLSNAFVFFILWIFYLSIVHIGQQFYGFGWETLLLETGFLAIFLCPLTDYRPFSKKMPHTTFIFPLILWLLFRNMFGAGLIKIRGDTVWRDLTALYYHFETQPVPNSLSWFFHQLPTPILKGGVLFNHFVELIVPFFLFGPRIIRHIGAGLIIIFQITLILSGNLSWLNWLTIVQCIPAFDDSFYAFKPSLPSPSKYVRSQHLTHLVIVIGTIILSYYPIQNMLNPHQRMNASFNPLRLVNTYGAFGSISDVRYELVIFGTSDAIITDQTQWKEYNFFAKPSLINERPPFFSPYHYRLDWHIWFAAMSTPNQHPWLIHFIYKLLHNDPLILSLLQHHPFPNAPPTFIKIDRYIYSFSNTFSTRWWKRRYHSEFLPTLSLEHRGLHDYINANYRY